METQGGEHATTECKTSAELSRNVEKLHELPQQEWSQQPFPSNDEEKVTTEEVADFGGQIQDAPTVYIQGARLHLITIGSAF